METLASSKMKQNITQTGRAKKKKKSFTAPGSGRPEAAGAAHQTNCGTRDWQTLDISVSDSQNGEEEISYPWE